jgi:hypothetical protein
MARAAIDPLQQPALAGWLGALRTLSALVLLGILPVLLTTVVIVGSIGHHFAFDFHSLWEAARDVRSGHDPYPAATVSALAPGEGFVYPPVVAFAALPLGLLPFGVAAAVMVLALVGCTAGTLWLLGVRDWRCFGAAYLSIPVLHDLRLGAISLVLTLAVVLTWRWRGRALAALPLAFAIVAKVFLWPLLVWLIATRRTALARRTIVLAIGATALAWAAIRFAGLAEYPHLLDVLSSIEQGAGYSPASAVLALGLGPGEARVLATALGLALLGGCVVLGRRGDDRRSLTLALAASLALSPIVWLHYFVLLLVPIALARRSFGLIWLVPVLFWLTPYEDHAAPWRVVAGIAIAVLALGLALRRLPLERRLVCQVVPVVQEDPLEVAGDRRVLDQQPRVPVAQHRVRRPVLAGHEHGRAVAHDALVVDALLDPHA